MATTACKPDAERSLITNGYSAGEYGMAQRNVEPDLIHPVQKIEQNRSVREMQDQLGMIKSVVGNALPLRYHTEYYFASRVGRLPGLHSSNLMMATLMGTDDTISMGDYLNHPDHHEKIVNPHPVGDILKK